MGLIAGGWIRYVMMSDQAGDYLQANLEMVRGTPDYKTREAIARMRKALAEVEDEYRREQGEDQSFVRHLFNYGADGRIGFFMVELVRPAERKIIGAGGRPALAPEGGGYSRRQGVVLQ